MLAHSWYSTVSATFLSPACPFHQVGGTFASASSAPATDSAAGAYGVYFKFELAKSQFTRFHHASTYFARALR
jgi:hypothetical protein